MSIFCSLHEFCMIVYESILIWIGYQLFLLFCYIMEHESSCIFHLLMNSSLKWYYILLHMFFISAMLSFWGRPNLSFRGKITQQIWKNPCDIFFKLLVLLLMQCFYMIKTDLNGQQYTFSACYYGFWMLSFNTRNVSISFMMFYMLR